jgi:Cu2+-containing amine oxidase
VYFDEPAQEFHFFKKPKNRIYEAMGMHELDLGIAMAHFELTSQENDLAGSWVIHSEAKTVEDLQYIISWKIKLS